jgi:hypothetical protein
VYGAVMSLSGRRGISSFANRHVGRLHSGSALDSALDDTIVVFLAGSSLVNPAHFHHNPARGKAATAIQKAHWLRDPMRSNIGADEHTLLWSCGVPIYDLPADQPVEPTILGGSLVVRVTT